MFYTNRRESKIDDLREEISELKDENTTERSFNIELNVLNDEKEKLIEELNLSLDEALKAKSRSQKLKWYYKSLCKNKSSLKETSYDERTLIFTQ